MSIEERASALLARLDREIARAETGTVAVGGLTKTGNDLERFLKLAASTCCRAKGSSLEAEISRRRVTKGAGTYATILREARPGTLGHPLSEAVASDLRAPRSRVKALIDLRNKNVHEGAVDLTGYKKTLSALASLLRPLVPPPPS